MSKKNYLLLLLSFFIYSISLFFGKVASGYSSTLFIFYYLLSLFFLAVYAILWQLSLKKTPLNVAYPLKSVTIIINMVLASILLKETVTINMLIGSLFIISGAYLIGADNE